MTHGSPALDEQQRERMKSELVGERIRNGISDRWLNQQHRIALVEPGDGPDDPQVLRLLGAFHEVSPTLQVWALSDSWDPGAVSISQPKDFTIFDPGREWSVSYALLTTAACNAAVWISPLDHWIVAGSKEFIECYLGDMERARQVRDEALSYGRYVGSENGDMILQQVDRYMSWV